METEDGIKTEGVKSASQRFPAALSCSSTVYIYAENMLLCKCFYLAE